MNAWEFFAVEFVVSAFWFFFVVRFTMKRSFFSLVKSGWENLKENKAVFITAFLLFGATALMNFLKVHFEKEISSIVGMDFTSYIWSIEGNFIKHIQSDNLVLISFFTFLYVVVYIANLVGTGVVLAAKGKPETFLRYAAVIFLSYAISMPIYTFFPVKEPWTITNSVKLLPDLIDPRIMIGIHRTAAGIYNCLPSMHTAFSTAIPLILFKCEGSNLRRYAFFTLITGVLIIFSTMFLGIHWFLDVVSGVFLIVAVVFPLSGVVVNAIMASLEPKRREETET